MKTNVERLVEIENRKMEFLQFSEGSTDGVNQKLRIAEKKIVNCFLIVYLR